MTDERWHCRPGREIARSMYRTADVLKVRRASYNEIAIHQEGPGWSVYLSRKATVRLALRLLWEAVSA